MVCELGKYIEILVDIGIMLGVDIVVVIVLGVWCMLIGWVYFYGLMVGGEVGVNCVIEIF